MRREQELAAKRDAEKASAKVQARKLEVAKKTVHTITSTGV